MSEPPTKKEIKIQKEYRENQIKKWKEWIHKFIFDCRFPESIVLKLLNASGRASAISLVRLRDLMDGSHKKSREFLSFLVNCDAIRPISLRGCKGLYSSAIWFSELLEIIQKEIDEKKIKFVGTEAQEVEDYQEEQAKGVSKENYF